MELDPAAAAAGTRLVVRDTIDSTNTAALVEARSGSAGPLWIVARQQTAGRGRRGRNWVSPVGNLYATLLLTDPSPPEFAPQLSFIAALSLHDAIKQFAHSQSVTLKWPNDVLCGGAKTAGILIEGEGTKPLAVAVGIGVNCVAHPQRTDYPATDLQAAGIDVSAAELFQALSGSMRRRLSQWDGGREFASVRADWLARADGLGSTIRVRLGDREMTGRFETLDGSGRLILRCADGTTKTITAGDVFPLQETVETLAVR